MRGQAKKTMGQARPGTRTKVVPVVLNTGGSKYYKQDSYYDDYVEDDYYDDDASTESEDDGMCPLCCEELDETEKLFYPCICGYQLCLFCYDRVKSECKSQCPGCRQIYGEPVTADQVIKKPKEKEVKPKRPKVSVATVPGPHTPPRSQWQGYHRDDREDYDHYHPRQHYPAPPPAGAQQQQQPPPQAQAQAQAHLHAQHHAQQKGWGLGNASWASGAGAGAPKPEPRPVVVSAEEFPSLADAMSSASSVGPAPSHVRGKTTSATLAAADAAASTPRMGPPGFAPSAPQSVPSTASRVAPLPEAVGMLHVLQGAVREGRTSSQDAAEKLCALLRMRQQEAAAPLQRKLRVAADLRDQVRAQQATLAQAEHQAVLRAQQAEASTSSSAPGGLGGKRPPPGFGTPLAGANANNGGLLGGGLLGGSSMLGGSSLLGMLQGGSLFGGGGASAMGNGGGLGSLEQLQALFSGASAPVQASNGAQGGLLGQADGGAFGAVVGGAHRPLYARGGAGGPPGFGAAAAAPVPQRTATSFFGGAASSLSAQLGDLSLNGGQWGN